LIKDGKMKITSYANSDFPIDGVSILPGTKNYKKIDPSKREVRYQLGILKADKIIDFKELIPARPHRLPFVEEEQGKLEDAEDLKKEKAVEDAKRTTKKSDGANKKSGKTRTSNKS
jgi:hypothetical protein